MLPVSCDPKRFGLKPQLALFVEAYVRYKNGHRAAIEAGYPAARVGPTSKRLLGHPAIRHAIETLLAEKAKTAKQREEYLLEKLYDYLDADLRDLYDAGGALRPIEEWPAAFTNGLVRVLEIRQVGNAGEREHSTQVTKVTLESRIQLLQMGMKQLGMLHKPPQDTARQELLDVAREVIRGAHGLRPGGGNMPDEVEDG